MQKCFFCSRKSCSSAEPSAADPELPSPLFLHLLCRKSIIKKALDFFSQVWYYHRKLLLKGYQKSALLYYDAFYNFITSSAVCQALWQKPFFFCRFSPFFTKKLYRYVKDTPDSVDNFFSFFIDTSPRPDILLKQVFHNKPQSCCYRKPLLNILLCRIGLAANRLAAFTCKKSRTERCFSPCAVLIKTDFRTTSDNYTYE